MSDDDLGKDILWGVPAIAEYVDVEVPEARTLIRKGIIPTKKLSHRLIIAFKSKIRPALENYVFDPTKKSEPTVKRLPRPVRRKQREGER